MIYMALWLVFGLLTLLMIAVVEWYVNGKIQLGESVQAQVFVFVFVLFMGPIGFVLTAIEVPDKIRRDKA